MGQTESAGAGDPSATPPSTPNPVAVTRGREDYLHRLGINKDKRAADNRSRNSATVEAPGLLETTKESEEGVVVGGGRGSTASLIEGEELSVEVPNAKEDFEMNVLDLKSQDDFRLGYLRKLSYQKVWVPKAQRPPDHQTVIIFDWDDTLLCTSYLNFRQDQPLQPSVERHLRGIESAAKRLLELAGRLGHTFIITNAMYGWVEYSAAKYVPDLLPVLQNVRVISARGKYEAQYPGEVSKWKIQAFLEVQRQLNSEIITNLISLGDSNFEMDAVHVMGKEFAQAMIKTIKFRENPSPEELLKQLDLVYQKFERIVENARNLKIGLERKWVGAGGAAGGGSGTPASVAAAGAAGGNAPPA